MVIEPGQDLGAGPVRARVVGEVSLPALVRQVGGEPDVGPLRPLAWLRAACRACLAKSVTDCRSPSDRVRNGHDRTRGFGFTRGVAWSADLSLSFFDNIDETIKRPPACASSVDQETRLNRSPPQLAA